MSMYRGSLFLPLLLLVSACRHEERAAPTSHSTPGPSAVSSQAAPPTAASSAASSPTPSSLPNVDAAEEAASVVVHAWNDALDRHDTARLAELYRDSVRFYGRGLKKAAVVAAKVAALQQQPTFHQQIVGPLELTHASDGSLTVNFVKRSGEAGKLRDTKAILVLVLRDGSWLIDGEGDVRPSLDAAALEACQGKAAEVVGALPEVKRAQASAMAEADASKGSSRFGGMGPNDDGDGGFAVASGLYTDESFQPQVSFLSRASGPRAPRPAGRANKAYTPRNAQKTWPPTAPDFSDPISPRAAWPNVGSVTTRDDASTATSA